MENVMWATIENFPNYEINNTGQIRETKSDIILSHQVFGDGTHYVVLIDANGNEQKVPVDILVATTFLPKKYVNSSDVLHVDGRKGNCSVDNLAWIDDDSAEKEYYKTHSTLKPAEYFKFYPLMEFPDSQYEINKMGQIRNKYTHKILSGGIGSGGYKAHTLRINKKTIYRLVHIMVAKQFIPNPESKPIVNHIDEDKTNPCIDNLEWATGAENIHHGTALKRGNLGRNKPVNEYSIQGRYIRTWKSKRILADFLDSLFPNVNNIHTVHQLLQYNLQNPVEKKAFANRVFTYYAGDCDDINFHAHELKYRMYNNPSLDGIDVPEDYLVYDFDDKVDSLDVLQEMTTGKPYLNNRQRQALKYAITCIKIVKENETVINKIAEVIRDYQSLKS